MAKSKRPAERREDALSRDRIVDAAIALLDDEGEGGLTFRALATRLSTGAGAIYWYVANKHELLVAATDAVVARSLEPLRSSTSPQKALHKIALAVFGTVDTHPWVGAELARAPWETPLLRIFERIGRQVEALGAKGGARFTATSALMNYIVGVSIQNAANGVRTMDPPTNRTDFLEEQATKWKDLDVREYPFTRTVATQLREHDDRAEFLAGIDLILGGIAASL